MSIIEKVSIMKKTKLLSFSVETMYGLWVRTLQKH